MIAMQTVVREMQRRERTERPAEPAAPSVATDAGHGYHAPEGAVDIATPCVLCGRAQTDLVHYGYRSVSPPDEADEE